MSTPENISIRLALAADIPALCNLAESTPHAAHWPAEKYHEIFTPAAPRRLSLVIEEAQGKTTVIQGFLIALCASPDWELENIAIERSHQQLGLGSRLLAEFLEMAHKAGAASVLLEVRESNLAARRFYEKSGFVQTGLRPNYYQQPFENAALYSFLFR
jgi:[ribosomal protein S18]-alanine N-acetyltransferase